MQLELGKIVEGKVTGITKFGAFIELAPSKVGLVHISEIASAYVNDITEHLQIGQTVSVKILSISEEGKISLSIRKAIAPSAQTSAAGNNHKSYRKPSPDASHKNARPNTKQAPSQNPNMVRHTPYQQTNAPGPEAFESMLNKFMKSSDEKISHIKKGRNGGRRPGQKRSR